MFARLPNTGSVTITIWPPVSSSGSMTLSTPGCLTWDRGGGGEGVARRQGRGQVGRGQRKRGACCCFACCAVSADACWPLPIAPTVLQLRSTGNVQPASQPAWSVRAGSPSAAVCSPAAAAQRRCQSHGHGPPCRHMGGHRGGSVQAQLGPLVHVPMTSRPAAAVPTSAAAAATAAVHHFHCCCYRCCCCLVAAAPPTCWPGP